MKKSITIEDKKALRKKKREKMRKYRLKKSIRDTSKNQSTSFDPNFDLTRRAFKSPMSFCKAIAKVKRNLPKTLTNTKI